MFFEGTFINNLFKLLVIIGGGFAMQKGAALIGNLISAGAGSRELMDNALGRLGSAAAMGGLKLAGKGLWAGGKKLFGGKKDDKSKDSKKEGESGENQNNGNEGDKLENDPKYNDSKDIGDKLKNEGGDEKKGGAGDTQGKKDPDPKSEAGAGMNNFNFGKDQANQATRDSITESLRNSTAGGLGSINEVDEDEED